MKFWKSIIIIFVFTLVITAQKKNFTIEDVVMNSYYSLSANQIGQLSWVPGTDNVSYVKDAKLFNFSAKTGKVNELSNLDEINSRLTSELRRFPRINWIDNNTFSFWNGSENYNFDLADKKAMKNFDISKNATNIEFSHDRAKVAFTIDNNLFVKPIFGKEQQVTYEENKGIVSGQSVSRNEFGITGGIFWSPKSNYLAFYQKDESNVTDYPLLEIGKMPATVNNLKYPMVGQTSEIVKVGIYDLSENKTIWLKTEGPKDQYLTSVTWGPNEEFIYVAHLNRDQDHLKLYKYDAKTGNQVKLLFEETDDEYVEPEYQLQFICPEDDKFIWYSERDGWNHLYLYNTDGEMLKQITKGEWIVKSIKGMDEKTYTIYFTGTKDTPVETHLYKVDIKSGEIKRLTKSGFNHSVIYNKEKKLFIDKYSSITTPNVAEIIDVDGNTVKVINKSKNPIADYNISKPKIFTLEGENNIELYSSLILPVNFDSTKKYPVIVYVYGGPHAQLVTNKWYYGRYDFWFQYMAQNGYIIFTLDNRGSDNRGLEFEQAIHGNLGTKEIADQLVGVDYLKSLPYVDSERIGVFGWSYGGFMTTSLMLRTNDTYKVGVAGGAVINWKMYEVMYGERYMDTPQKNPEGYKNSCLLNYVENLNGKLLLVHGTSDPTVVLEHALEFAKKATNLNKPLDFFPYVGHGHGVRGRDAIHLYEKISNYFFDNL